jgi:hypothetical protein
MSIESNPSTDDEVEIRECDFCNQILDDDDELVPIFIGEPPEPESQRVTAQEKRKSGGPMIFGKRTSQWVALYNALHSAPNISVEMNDHVLRADAPDLPVMCLDPENAQTAFDDPDVAVTKDRDTSQAIIEIEPNTEQPDPDLEVCQYCIKHFDEEAP